MREASHSLSAASIVAENKLKDVICQHLTGLIDMFEGSTKVRLFYFIPSGSLEEAHLPG